MPSGVRGRHRHRRHLHRLRRRRRRRERHPRQGVLDAARLLRRDPRRPRHRRRAARHRRGRAARRHPALPPLVDGGRERGGRRHARARGRDHHPRVRGHALRHARRLRPLVRPDRGREAEPGRHGQAAADRPALADRRDRGADGRERRREGRGDRRARSRRPCRRSSREGVDAIGVSTLWSFANPAHGAPGRRGRASGSRPDAFLTLSHEIAPVVGEYERTSTAALNARLGPVVHGYLDNLRAKLAEQGFSGQLLVAQAYGGLLPVDEAATRPVGMIESGPVSGLVGSQSLGEQLGLRNIIAADMGGTTFKVGTVREGLIEYQRESMVLRYHYALPKLDVVSLGLAGGSIISVDERTGTPRIGPRSAGSYPGPVCYAHGGEEPTITDIDAILGYLNPELLPRAAAPSSTSRRRARLFEEKVAEPLGLDADRGGGGDVQAREQPLLRPPPQDDGAARPRPAPLRALLVRRHRGHARRRLRRGARRLDDRDPALGRRSTAPSASSCPTSPTRTRSRARCARPFDLGAIEETYGRAGGADRASSSRRRASSATRCGSTARSTCATGARCTS